MVIVQPDQGLFFPAVEYVEEKVMEAALEDEKPKSVVVDMRSVYGVDYTTVQVGVRGWVRQVRDGGR